MAARHPSLLHSVVLDSAYPVRGLDPLNRSSGPAARTALNAVCARDAGCHAATAGDSSTPVQRLTRLVARLRVGPPLRGMTIDTSGRRVTRIVGVRTLADLVQDGASYVTVDRELDAAVRAALTGDGTPLLRLVADRDDSNAGAARFSDGPYFAVACTDYPQLFSMAAEPPLRALRLRNRLEADASLTNFAPFRAPSG